MMNYTEFETENIEQRRKLLQGWWNFECICERCEYADDSVDDRHPEITQVNISQAKGCRHRDADRRLKIIENRLNVQCDNDNDWNPTAGEFCIEYSQECYTRVD